MTSASTCGMGLILSCLSDTNTFANPALVRDHSKDSAAVLLPHRHHVQVYCWFIPVLQFLLYIDSTSLSSPMEIETDGIGMDDVALLKKTVEEEATQVNTTTHCE